MQQQGICQTDTAVCLVATGICQTDAAAATGMYFNLITNRTRPAYNNETNTKKPSYPHTAHSQ